MAKTKETAGANGELSAFAPFHALFTGTWGGNKMFTEALRASQQEMLDFAIKRLHHTEEALEDLQVLQGSTGVCLGAAEMVGRDHERLL